MKNYEQHPVKVWRKALRAGLILLTSPMALAIWLLGLYALNFV